MDIAYGERDCIMGNLYELKVPTSKKYTHIPFEVLEANTIQPDFCCGSRDIFQHKSIDSENILDKFIKDNDI